MKQKFLEMLRLLASGVDPFTGEMLPSESVVNKPEFIRSMFTLIEEFGDRPKRKNKSRSGGVAPRDLDALRERNISNGRPPRSHFPWNIEEKIELERLFSAGVQISAIAEKFERSNISIIAQLQALELISREESVALSKIVS
jgi:hypothetical protein